MRRLWQWPRLRWQEAWVAMRAHPWRVTLIAAPWLLGLLTVVPMLWYEMDRAVRLPERQAAQDALENAAQSMLRRLGRLRDDTRFIAFLTPRLLETGSEAQLLETYTSFLMAGRDYHKVRWMDATGQERLRVDQEVAASCACRAARCRTSAAGRSSRMRCCCSRARSIFPRWT